MAVLEDAVREASQALNGTTIHAIRALKRISEMKTDTPIGSRWRIRNNPNARNVIFTIRGVGAESEVYAENGDGEGGAWFSDFLNRFEPVTKDAP
jgi:hypothetical protein